MLFRGCTLIKVDNVLWEQISIIDPNPYWIILIIR